MSDAASELWHNQKTRSLIKFFVQSGPTHTKGNREGTGGVVALVSSSASHEQCVKIKRAIMSACWTLLTRQLAHP